MLKLSGLFGDHAVLQRDRMIPVWGWSRPSARIEGRLGTVTVATQAGEDGRFLLRFPPQPAGGPFQLEVEEAGGEKVIFSDLLIGEVWLAGGQSNMEFQIAGLPERLEEIRAEAAAAARPIRTLTVPRRVQLSPVSDICASWLSASAEDISGWSAAGYFFARKLHDELGIPVGIVTSSWGGTIAEAWTSRETLVRNPDFSATVASYEERLSHREFWDALSAEELDGGPIDAAALEQARFRRLLPRVTENRGEAAGWANFDFRDEAWKAVELPAMWRQLDADFNGVIWFRREVEIPSEWAGHELLLEIGSVDKHDITYFNGVEVGRTGSGFETCFWDKPRHYRVPGHLVRPGRAVIAVRNYSFVYDGGLNGPVEAMKLHPADTPSEAIGLAGIWRMGVELNQGKQAPPTALMGPGNPNSFYMLFNNMIQPLIPMAMRGVIWYQGESNEGAPGYYKRLMSDLIRDWRRHWGQGDFPFLQVVLAGFRTPCAHDRFSAWALIREAQLQSAAETGNLVASAVDLGDAGDIHPHRKQEVGERLALAALAQVYGGVTGEGSGPLFREMVREAKAIRLSFDHAYGLRSEGAPSGFVIAGADRVFRPAQAVIEGCSVVVSSPEVADPIAVRYGWSDNPVSANLYNAAGLPMLPFRTDSFPRE